MRCPQCNIEFEPKPWPATRAKYCSIICNKSAYRKRHKEELREKWRVYQQVHRDRRLKSQRRYNNSPKGLAMKVAFHKKKRAEYSAKQLTTYHADAELRAKQRGREISREKLLKHRPRVCDRCSSLKNVQCHHRDDNPCNTDLANLQWLCHICHRLVHSDPLGLDGQTLHSIQDFLPQSRTAP